MFYNYIARCDQLNPRQERYSVTSYIDNFVFVGALFNIIYCDIRRFFIFYIAMYKFEIYIYRSVTYVYEKVKFYKKQSILKLKLLGIFRSINRDKNAPLNQIYIL